MADLSEFDFGSVEESVWPRAGEFTVEAVDSKVTKDESGNRRVAWRLKVTEGPDAGRIIFLDTTIVHVKEVVQRIGRKQLKAIFSACGFEEVPGDTSEAYNIPFKAKISLYKEKWANLESARKISATEVEDPFA